MALVLVVEVFNKEQWRGTFRYIRVSKCACTFIPQGETRLRDYDIVVFSHLRWDFVYQRPQHLLSRLAARRPVLFVEEPVHDPDGGPSWQFARPQEGVLVCRPHTPVKAVGFCDEQLPCLRLLLSRLLADAAGRDYVCWFYTPMALPLAAGLAPRAVVYDCMDELSAFKFAPPELLRREADL